MSQRQVASIDLSRHVGRLRIIRLMDYAVVYVSVQLILDRGIALVFDDRELELLKGAEQLRGFADVFVRDHGRVNNCRRTESQVASARAPSFDSTVVVGTGRQRMAAGKPMASALHCYLSRCERFSCADGWKVD